MSPISKKQYCKVKGQSSYTTLTPGANTYTYANGTFTFHKVLPAGDQIRITYHTTLKAHVDRINLHNKATITASNLSGDNYRQVNYEYKHNYISKSGNNNGNGSADWTLTVDPMSFATGTDTIVVTDQLNVASDLLQIQNVAVKTASGTVLTEGTDYSLTVTNQNAINITLKSGAIAKLQSEKLLITYSTVVTDKVISGDYPNKLGSIQNNAAITWNGASYGKDSKTIDITWKSIVTKTASYTNATAPDVVYTITINPDGKKLSADDKTVLTLTDVLPSSMILDEVKSFTGLDGKTPVSGCKYQYSSENKTLTVTIPDQTPIVMTYTTTITLKVGEKLTEQNATNTCSLNGHSQAPSSSKLVTTVKHAYGSTDSQSGSATIHKVDAVTGVFITDSSAVFSLARCNTQTDGNKVSVSSSSTVNGKLATNNAVAKQQSLAFDNVYSLTEVKAPDGYQLAAPVYFVINGSTGTYQDVSSIYVDGEAYKLYVVKGLSIAEITVADTPVPKTPDTPSESGNTPGTPTESGNTPGTPDTTVTTTVTTTTTTTTTDTGYVLGERRAPDAIAPTLDADQGEVLGASRAPKTSDESKAILWALVMGASGAGMVALLARRKRQNRLQDQSSETNTTI